MQAHVLAAIDAAIDDDWESPLQRIGDARKNRLAAIAFIGIGLLIFAGVYFAAERLVYRNGHSNPFFKIATTEVKAFDWAILGASHAMPLDFSDFNDQMQRATGLKIINLALPGTGPLYNFCAGGVFSRPPNQECPLCGRFLRFLFARMERGSLRRCKIAQSHAIQSAYRVAAVAV